MSEYLDNLVKCFSNSRIGVNLTTVLIDNEPWFIAKEVADILGYENAPQAIRANVNELDQKMLSCAECKEIFSDLLTIDEEDSLLLNAEDPETVGSYGSLRVLRGSTRKSAMKINSNGMKLINEPGLYSLIFSSKKPEAQQFQRGESIRDQPNPKDPSYAPTPYFTKRTVDQLFECIERDSNYLKSFK